MTLQVKTTVWAMRTRGRGDAKQPYECQWDIGWPSAKHSLVPFFVLVDLKNFAELPDCYIVPLRVIRRYFKRGPKNWPRARYHERIEKLAPFKNKWALLKRALRSR